MQKTARLTVTYYRSINPLFVPVFFNLQEHSSTFTHLGVPSSSSPSEANAVATSGSNNITFITQFPSLLCCRYRQHVIYGTECGTEFICMQIFVRVYYQSRDELLHYHIALRRYCIPHCAQNMATPLRAPGGCLKWGRGRPPD